jgi:FkbM family methyltransferase
MTTSALTIPVLSRHLSTPFCVVDVGCRWGFSPLWDRLVPFVSLVGFDVDEAEIDRLRQAHSTRSDMRFVAQALGSEESTRTLYRTREPGGTSFLKPAVDDVAHYGHEDGATIESEEEVHVTTLDAWAATSGLDRVDALKLDTQGSELDILQGATQTLETVRLIELEVAFNEIAEDGPLFGELDAHLRARGFALWRLRDLAHYPIHGVVGAPPTVEYFWYGPTVQTIEMPGGQFSWCNAYYVPRTMYTPGTTLGWEARIRDACLTESLLFHDLAMLSLRHALVEDCPAEIAAEITAILDAVAMEQMTPAGQ